MSWFRATLQADQCLEKLKHAPLPFYRATHRSKQKSHKGYCHNCLLRSAGNISFGIDYKSNFLIGILNI